MFQVIWLLLTNLSASFEQSVTEIRQSDWMFQVSWLLLTKQSTLFIISAKCSLICFWHSILHSYGTYFCRPATPRHPRLQRRRRLQLHRRQTRSWSRLRAVRRAGSTRQHRLPPHQPWRPEVLLHQRQWTTRRILSGRGQRLITEIIPSSSI